VTDYVYNDEFDGIVGVIEGSQFDPHFAAIETAIASKADIAGPVTHTGTHTFGGVFVNSTFDATGVTTAAFAAITATTGVFSGALSGLTLAGAADTTDIDGGTWA